MNGISWRPFVISLTVALALSQAASAQTSAPGSSNPAAGKNVICKFYALGELANDPNLGRWLVATIPQMIERGTWSNEPTFYEPGRLLVVTHTAAVHAQVDDFLKGLKKSLPTHSPGQQGLIAAKEWYEARGLPTTPFNVGVAPQVRQPEAPEVLRAQYTVPAAIKAPDAVSANKSAAYPVPAPLSQPKHLFHLVVRYEGDGVLDAAVSDAIKALNGSATPKEEKSEDTAKSEPVKPSQMSQLLHFIVRYEGDGIIDSSVVEFMKAFKDYAVQDPSPRSMVGCAEGINFNTPVPPPYPVGVPVPPGCVVPVPPIVQAAQFQVPGPGMSVQFPYPSPQIVTPRMPQAD